MAVPNPTQITSTLRMMPDQQLQQYAAMHKDDPYIFPMAFAESNARKQARAAQQATAMGQPQQKVVDQDLMAMAPEDSGIGALDAPNMQRMADGGIAGYADGGEFNYSGGSDGPLMNMAGGGEPVMRMAKGGATGGLAPELQQYLLEQAQANNVDPQALMAIVKAESGGQIGAQNAKSTAQGLFQITKDTFARAGGDPSKRTDPFENIRVGAKLLGDNAKVLRNQLKRDPSPDELYATHFLGTGTGSKLLQAHPDTPMSSFLHSVDAKHANNIMSSNKSMLGGKTVGEVRKTLADKLFSAIPMGAAHAEVIPTAAAAPAVPGDMASQIPGQRVRAPASTAEQENSFLGRMADKIGIPAEYQRNISNTMNALGGYSAPAAVAGKVGTASKALEATPEMIAKAEQARRVANTTRLPAPAKAGLEALDAASAETRAAAEAARQTRNLEQDRRAATAAERSVQAADETANIARTAEEGITTNAAKIARTENAAANAAKAARAGMATQRLTQGLGGGEAAAGAKGPNVYDIEDMRKADEMPTAKEAVDVAKEALPAKERKGMNYDDLLAFGLNLMAGTSTNALANVGAAGIAALKNKQEREKTEQDVEYKDIMKKYYGSLSKKAESEAAYLDSGEKARTVDRQHALDAVQKEMAKWQQAHAGMYTPAEEEAQRTLLTKYYFGGFGLPNPSTMGPSTGGGLPQGVKVTPYG